MSRAFFGNVIATPQITISTSGVSASKNAVTSAISTIASTTGGGTLTYSWQTTGNSCTINSQSATSTTLTGGGVAGTSNLFCNITNSANNTIYSSPICIITWNPSTSITSVIWSITSATTSAYNGAAQSVVVSSINPAAATYSLATTTATNAGGIASTILTGTLDYDGTFTSPNLTIGTSTIAIASSGSTSKSYTGGAQSVAYTLSGVYAADTGYSVSGTSATNCNNYTVTLSETSTNYTLGALGTNTFGWAITPTAPANFTVTSVDSYYLANFSWTAVGGCTYQLWGLVSGEVLYSLYQDNITATTTSYAGATNFSYQFYVVAVAPSGTSGISRQAYVYMGRAAYQDTIGYDSGYANQQPLCLSGTQSGTIGLKAFPQGTYGITISTVSVQNASLNGNFSSLLWGTGSRIIRWNLNGTAVNFPLSTSTSATNPYAGPTSRNTTTTGTITYTMVATGTGWSTNNTSGLSGSFWARAQWKWAGTQVVTVAANPPTISYTG
jgi:hypothetical protein